MNNHSTNEKQMKVIDLGARIQTQAPADHFTGTVYITPVVKGEEPSCLTCISVSFETCARSDWHTHPKGQLLIVTKGNGLIQEWGKPICKIQQGDMIWTPPGVKHWHGGSYNEPMTHTAIQEAVDGKNVQWLEKVTEEQYRGDVG
jgi:quercetin dioxygenase-like cupin family protein